MTGNIERRLATLESDVRKGHTFHCWQEPGETAEEAIGRRFPDGVPAGHDLVIYSFAEIIRLSL